MEATTERLIEIASNVAPLITGRWKHDKRPADNDYNHNRQNSTIFNVDRPEIRFSITRGFAYADRFKAQVSGDFSRLRREYTGYFESSSIKFSYERNFRSIANDINNRFLPDFIKQYDTLKLRISDNIQTKEKFNIKEAMFDNLFDDTHKTHSNNSLSSGEYYCSGPDMTYQLSGEIITIKHLNLTLDQFVKLIFELKEVNQ